MIALWLAACVPEGTGVPDPALVALGERLFFDPALSANGTMSCASCHDPALAFADGRPVSVGVTGTPLPRNAPSLLGVSLLDPLGWAHPGVHDLATQAFVPLYADAPPELGATPDRVVAAIPEHLHRAAFGPVAPRAEHARQAMAAYQGTLIDESPYDAWLRGEDALTTEAEAGRALFEDLGCAVCHAGPRLTLADRTLAHADPFRANGTMGEDPGLYAHTGDLADLGRFRVPSLRNVARTAPYLHDGSLPTLDAVLDHYDGWLDLGLASDERLALGAFFVALDGVVP